jgi:hypothetical protein
VSDTRSNVAFNIRDKMAAFAALLLGFICGNSFTHYFTHFKYVAYGIAVDICSKYIRTIIDANTIFDPCLW